MLSEPRALEPLPVVAEGWILLGRCVGILALRAVMSTYMKMKGLVHTNVLECRLLSAFAL